MSLLREIQEAAIDSNVELAVLLRKCKVLAARLGNPEFKQWVDAELNGYSGDGYPDYRTFNVFSRGNFVGAFNHQLNGADIPMLALPEKFRKGLSCTKMREPIASLEALVKQNSDGVLHEPWDPDIVAVVGEEIYTDMRCQNAWKVVPVSGVIAALDAVRNRVLSFVLEIESEYPDAGEATINSNPVPQEKVNQYFTTYISEGVQNVAVGSTDVRQKAVNNSNNDELFSNLIAALRGVDAEEDVLSEITTAVEEMKSSQNSTSFLSRYQNFMSILSDHIQVFGPVVAPYMPALVEILK